MAQTPAQPRDDAAAGARARHALLAVNFFAADVQAGVGPFLGVMLAAAGWRTGAIGTVMTLGGLAGVALAGPAGALVDASRRKRAWLALSGLLTVLASLALLLSDRFWPVALSQLATGAAGALVGPGIAGLTLGIVRQGGFLKQNGRNQAFNHAGNLAAAAACGLAGWRFGFAAVVLVVAAFGALSVLSLLFVPARCVDHEAARGLADGRQDGARPKGFANLLGCRPLLVLAACLGLFHLGNAAILPLYGMAVVQAGRGQPAVTVALTVIVAQGVMVVMSILAMRLAASRGYWTVMLITFIALPIRGLVAGALITGWGVWPVQILDGVGAGLQSVAVPGLVARIMAGTGRVNVGQGAVMTAQGIGAALSPALGAHLAQALGYPFAFALLGSLSLGALALWILFARDLRPHSREPRPAAARPGAPEAFLGASDPA